MLKPLFDRIVVSRIESEAVSAGGIVVPESHKKKQQRGKVLAVGPGNRLKSGAVIPLGVKVGETVVFEMFTGSEVEVKGETFVVLKESDLLGVVEA